MFARLDCSVGHIRVFCNCCLGSPGTTVKGPAPQNETNSNQLTIVQKYYQYGTCARVCTCSHNFRVKIIVQFFTKELQRILIFVSRRDFNISVGFSNKSIFFHDSTDSTTVVH